MVGAWSLATPVGTAPDEGAQMTQAVAIVHGQFDVRVQPLDGQPVSWVRVACWVDNPWVHLEPPACTPGHATTAVAPTEFSNYPPLYYVVVGLPSLFLSGSAAISSMRALGDVLDSVMVALGIWLLLRYYPRRTLLIGVLMALSPMVLFLMAVLNSSGLEIGAGFAAWCGMLCVVTHPEVPRALAVWTSVAAILLVLSRPTSPFDLVVIAVVLAVYVGWRGLRERVNPSLRALWIPIALSLAVASVFLVIDGSPHLIGVPPRHPADLLSNVATTLRLTGGYVEQGVGKFGLVNVPAPTWVITVWEACLAALTAVAVVLSVPCRRALPVLTLAIVIVTVALEAPKLNVVGAYFQGRYILPLMVGFPLVASSFEWRGRIQVARRMLTTSACVVGIVLLVAQVAAFETTLQAYTAGHRLNGAPANWSPPGGVVLVEVVFVVGAILTLALVVVMISDAGHQLLRAETGSELVDRREDTVTSGRVVLLRQP